MAYRDDERYRKQMHDLLSKGSFEFEDWELDANGKVEIKEPKKMKPKKPLAPYNIFLKLNIKAFKKQWNCQSYEAMQQMAKIWKVDMTEADKSPF